MCSKVELPQSYGSIPLYSCECLGQVMKVQKKKLEKFWKKNVFSVANFSIFTMENLWKRCEKNANELLSLEMTEMCLKTRFTHNARKCVKTKIHVLWVAHSADISSCLLVRSAVILVQN